MDKRTIIAFAILIMGIVSLTVAAENNQDPTDLKTYYTQEKLFWDNYLLTHCTSDTASKKCETAQGMQKTYVILLTDLMRDSTAKRFGTQEAARRVYEVPAAPTANEETAGLTDPQPAVENIP